MRYHIHLTINQSERVYNDFPYARTAETNNSITISSQNFKYISYSIYHKVNFIPVFAQ